MKMILYIEGNYTIALEIMLNVSSLLPSIPECLLEIDGRPVANHKLLVQ